MEEKGKFLRNNNLKKKNYNQCGFSLAYQKDSFSKSPKAAAVYLREENSVDVFDGVQSKSCLFNMVL